MSNEDPVTAEPLDDILTEMRKCVGVEGQTRAAVLVPVAHLAAVTDEVDRLRAENQAMTRGVGCPECHAPSWRELAQARAALATARRDALTEAADQITEHQAVAGRFNADKAAGLGRAAVLLRARAAQEEGR